MTFGADGIALAFLLILVLIVVGIGFLVGVVLLVIGLVRMSAGKRARFLAWSGAALTALPFVLVIALLVYGRIAADPDPLRFDLRTATPEKDLPGERSPGFPAYDYTTDHVDLTLADGTRFKARVEKVVVWLDDDRAGSIELRLDVKTLAGARRTAARWSGDLNLPTTGLDEATDDWAHHTGGEWETRHGRRSVSIDITGPGHIIIWAYVGIPDSTTAGQSFSKIETP